MSAHPDPAFIEFFSGDYRSQSDWQKLLDSVPYDMSWDRKAAWLLWTLGQQYDGETPWHWRDVFAKQSIKVNAPVETVNHVETEYTPPVPGGVPLTFNSGDYPNA